MTQSDVPEVRPGPSRLSWKSWLLLALALSTIGSQLMVWGAAAIESLYVGNSTDIVFIIVTDFYGSRRLFDLGFVFLQSLTINIFGALVLMAFFAIRRRLKG